MLNYSLVARDGGSALHVTILDSATKLPMDLTAKTITVRYSLNGGPTVEQPMTPRNQTTSPGQADYLFLVTDLIKGGILDGEVRLQSGLADQLTTVDTFHLSVKEPLP